MPDFIHEYSLRKSVERRVLAAERAKDLVGAQFAPAGAGFGETLPPTPATAASPPEMLGKFGSGWIFGFPELKSLMKHPKGVGTEMVVDGEGRVTYVDGNKEKMGELSSRKISLTEREEMEDALFWDILKEEDKKMKIRQKLMQKLMKQ